LLFKHGIFKFLHRDLLKRKKGSHRHETSDCPLCLLNESIYIISSTSIGNAGNTGARGTIPFCL
jgi:hypothetical protein